MGRPKAWLQIGDELLLSRMVRIIGLVVSPVVAATRRGLELPPLPLDTGVAYDAEGTAGPLAGIAAGFDALCGRCDAAFVAACDHVLLSAAFVKRMIELLADHDAVVPEHGISFNAPLGSPDRTAFTQLWAVPAAEDGATAMTIFQYSQLAERAGPPAPDRANYLNEVGQFLPVNVYTGQIMAKR